MFYVPLSLRALRRQSRQQKRNWETRREIETGKKEEQNIKEPHRSLKIINILKHESKPEQNCDEMWWNLESKTNP